MLTPGGPGRAGSVWGAAEVAESEVSKRRRDLDYHVRSPGTDRAMMYGVAIGRLCGTPNRQNSVHGTSRHQDAAAKLEARR